MNLTHKNILLVKVNDGRLVVFNNALEKEAYMRQNDDRGYHINTTNSVTEHLYICIDTEGTGWVLNKDAMTLPRCKELIKMYL